MEGRGLVRAGAGTRIAAEGHKKYQMIPSSSAAAATTYTSTAASNSEIRKGLQRKSEEEEEEEEEGSGGVSDYEWMLSKEGEEEHKSLLLLPRHIPMHDDSAAATAAPTQECECEYVTVDVSAAAAVSSTPPLVSFQLDVGDDDDKRHRRLATAQAAAGATAAVTSPGGFFLQLHGDDDDDSDEDNDGNNDGDKVDWVSEGEGTDHEDEYQDDDEKGHGSKDIIEKNVRQSIDFVNGCDSDNCNDEEGIDHHGRCEVGIIINHNGERGKEGRNNTMIDTSEHVAPALSSFSSSSSSSRHEQHATSTDARRQQQEEEEAMQQQQQQQELMARAVRTAASMADWAGRAVRLALREHQSNQFSAGNISFSDGSNTIPTVAESSGAHANSSSGCVTISDVNFSTSSAEEGSALCVEGELQKRTAVTSVQERDGDRYDRGNEEEGTAAVLESNNYLHGHREEEYDIGLGEGEDEEEGVREEVRDARRRMNAALRDTDEGLTDELRDEVIELLRALGLPYLIAPFEAEAQCAVLEQVRYGTVGTCRALGYYNSVLLYPAEVRIHSSLI